MRASSSLTYYTTLTILVTFSTLAFLGFSLGIELKPAKAFFGIDAAIQIAFTQLWDTLKSLAKVVLVKFVSNFVIKIMQKLESLHVIKNILYYSDALEFDQYLGNQLNKIVLKPKTQAEAQALEDPEDTNIGSIAAEADLNLRDLNPGQIEDLAGSGDYDFSQCQTDPATGEVLCPLPEGVTQDTSAGTGTGVRSDDVRTCAEDHSRGWNYTYISHHNLR